MKITDIQDEIIEEFSLFDNKNDSYTYLIELGKKLSDLPEKYRSDENIIKGCQSKVWLVAEMETDKIRYFADSDSTLVKGIVSLLVRILSEQTPQAILDAELYFIDQIGLKQMLSMNRSNGLASMIKQIKFYALAFSAKQNSLTNV